MAIDKIFPRRLSKSKDSRLRKKDEMTDALNVRVTDDSRELYGSGYTTSITDSTLAPNVDVMGESTEVTADGATGNTGVIKPVVGNTLVAFTDDTDLGPEVPDVVEDGEGEEEGEGEGEGNTEERDTTSGSHKIIGRVEDKANDYVYFFLYHDNPNKHSVVRYRDATETGSSEAFETVLTTNWFNFNANSVVQGVITQVSSTGFGEGVGTKSFLYFTDNQNEPRCLDIDRCVDGLTPDGDNDMIEFISLCPRTPVIPVQYEWANDTSRSISNFKNIRGFQFAYQNVYKNSVVSAFSIYSTLAVNPGYLSQGADPTPEIDNFNKLVIRIPKQSENVDFMKLYAREGNKGAWFYIADIDNSGTADVTINSAELQDGTEIIPRDYFNYNFYNDQIVAFIPDDQTFKQFDNVPQLADAISLSNDRVFLGNYVEGYDNINATANISPKFIGRPEDFASFDVIAIPETRIINGQAGCPNRITGYRIDLSGIPSEFAGGTTIQLNITVNPDKNIHIYNSQHSHHSSTFATFHDGTGKESDKIVDNGDDKLWYTGGGAANEYKAQDQYFGKVPTNNTKVFGGMNMTIKDIGWDPVASSPQTPQTNASAAWETPFGTYDVCYGTGASNPLIIQGKPMNFGCTIFFEENYSRTDAIGLIKAILNGDRIASADAGITAEDLGPTEDFDYIVAPGAVVTAQSNTAQYLVNTGLGNFSQINGFGVDANRSRICAVGDRLQLESSNPKGIPPCGYFILASGVVDFRLTVINDTDVFDPSRQTRPGGLADELGYQNALGDHTYDIFVALDLEDIRSPQVLTCLPDIVGGLAPTTMGYQSTSIVENIEHTGVYGDVEIQDQAGFYRHYVPGSPGPLGGSEGIAFLNDKVGGFTPTPFPMQHHVRKWICLRPSWIKANLINSQNGVSQLLDTGLFDQFMAEDYRKVLNGNFIGGYGMDYSNGQTSWEIIANVIDDQYGDQGQGNSGEIFSRSYDYGSHAAVVEQLSRLFGALRLPGRSLGTYADDGIGGNEGGGPGALPQTKAFDPAGFNQQAQDFGTFLFGGSLVPNVRRIVQAARDINPVYSVSGSASEIRTKILAYTLVDGESGPGSNTITGSINSTIIRDGILYWIPGSGLNGHNGPELNAAMTGGYDQSNIQNEGINYYYNKFGEYEIKNPSKTVSMGMFVNPFEYYLGQAYLGNHTYIAEMTDPSQTMKLGQGHAFYDGEVDGDVFPNGSPSHQYRYFSENTVGEFTSDDLTGENAAVEFGEGVYEINSLRAWYRLFLPHVEIVQQVSYIQQGGDGFDTKSFKTNATHSFGIVYSDFYGRQSGVMPLGSQFVPPYEAQSGGDGGAVQMQIQITSNPPDWAHHYQIVYGGNTSYENFIQYSAAGAYVAANEIADAGQEDLGVVSSSNLYVSLAYLQGNSDISYTNAFGARSDEGLDRMWDFQPGDKVKVISFYEGAVRKFANNVIFDVVNQVQLEGNDDNPLAPFGSGENIPKNLQGEFLVLKNNPFAAGFDVQSVKDGVDVWNNRCIIEIFRPASSSSIGDRPFFEIGQSFRVLRDADGNLSHELNPITIKNGDVYFRRLPVNLPPQSGNFPLLVNAEGSSSPAFFSYFLESPRFNDLIAGAKQNDFGRAKIVQPNAAQVRRATSLIFSDQNDYATNPLALNSFDATKQNFKDIPNQYGEIACLIDYNEGLFVLQKNKASYLPINRTIISDVSGSDSIIATSKVIGTQRYYAGEYGCDTNPESVCVVNNTIYWANKRLREVYKFNPSKGIQVISGMGMKSYFDKLFSQAQGFSRLSGGPVRVVGGYDPRNDEYILSVYNQNTFSWSPNQIVTQDVDDAIEDVFVDDTLGDLNAEQEAALQLQLDIAIAELAASQDIIATLEQQLAELYAQVNGLIDENDPTAFNEPLADLFAEINELEDQLANEIPVLQANIDAQVSAQGAIYDLASNIFAVSVNSIGNIDRLLGDLAGTVSAEDYELPSTGENFQLFELREYFAEEQTWLQENLIFAYLTTNTTALLRTGDEYSFITGYGAGPIPAPDSLIGLRDAAFEAGEVPSDGNDHLQALRGRAVTFRNDMLTYDIQAVQDLGDKLVEQEEEIQDLQASKQELLSQVGQIAAGINALRGPDTDKPLDEVSPVNITYGTTPKIDIFGGLSAADITEIGGQEGFDASIFIETAAAAYDSGQLDLIEDLIFDADGTPTGGLQLPMLQKYFDVGFNYNFWAPNRARRQDDDTTIVGLQVTRDVLAAGLGQSISALGASLTGEAGATLTELQETLVSAGVDANVAAVLIDPGATPENIIAALDGADEPEDLNLLPFGSIGVAFGEFLNEEIIGVEIEGIAVGEAVERVWEDLRDPLGELYDGLLDVSDEAGVFDESMGIYEDGFNGSNIGIVNDIRALLTSDAWLEGDAAQIITATNQLKERFNNDTDGRISVINALQRFKFDLAEAITPAATNRFTENPFLIDDVGLGGVDILRRSVGSIAANNNRGPFSKAYANYVIGTIQDVEFAIEVAKEFQDLFTFEQTEANLQEVLQSTARNPDIVGDVDTSGGPTLGQAVHYGGKQGVTAGDVLRGASIVGYEQISGSQVVNQSTLFAFSQAMNAVNQRIKDLGSYAAAVQANNPSGQGIVSNFNYRPPLNKNGELLTLPDVESSLLGPSDDIYPPTVRNLRQILATDSLADVRTAIAAETGTGIPEDNIINVVRGSLDPTSEFYSQEMLQFVIDNFVTYGYQNAGADLNGDGSVGVGDLLQILGEYGNINFPDPQDISIPTTTEPNLDSVLNGFAQFADYSGFNYAPQGIGDALVEYLQGFYDSDITIGVTVGGDAGEGAGPGDGFVGDPDNVDEDDDDYGTVPLG